MATDKFVQALVVGLEILPSPVAALLNAIPAWAKRGPARRFNRQSVNHFVARAAGPPVPSRLLESWLTVAIIRPTLQRLIDGLS